MTPKAQLVVFLGRFGADHVRISGSYETVEECTAEYQRIADLLAKKGERGNDLPKTITITDIEGSHTFPLDEVVTVGVANLEKANARVGAERIAYPHLWIR